jgi:hypothetical protein
MSLTSLIAQNENNVKLAQKIVKSLSEKFSFSEEEGWTHVCNKPVTAINRKLRRNHKKNDPLAKVKKPRTAFSFFTQLNREKIHVEHKDAKFGDLARLVSAAWKALTAEELASYKLRETEDKKRYDTELSSVKAKLASGEGVEAVVAAPAADSAPAKAKRVKSAKAAAPAAGGAASEVSATSAPAKSTKATKTAAAAPAAAAPTTSAPVAAPVAAAPVAEAKAAKSPKAAKTAAPAPVAAAAAPVVAAAPAVVKAPKAPKVVKA